MSDARFARRSDLGMITLRAEGASPRLEGALTAATGCVPPGTRRIEVAGDSAVAWMAPDEWLLFGPASATDERLAALEAALAGMHHLALDVSDARAVFRLTGPGARDVLAKGAPVDFAPDAFGPGDFRRTRLGMVAAAIWSPQRDVFELMCFRSVADHVALWLAETTRAEGASGLYRA